MPGMIDGANRSTNADGATVPKMSRQAVPTSPGVRVFAIALHASSRASNSRARPHHPTHGRGQTQAEEEEEDAEAARVEAVAVAAYDDAADYDADAAADANAALIAAEAVATASIEAAASALATRVDAARTRVEADRRSHRHTSPKADPFRSERRRRAVERRLTGIGIANSYGYAPKPWMSPRRAAHDDADIEAKAGQMAARIDAARTRARAERARAESTTARLDAAGSTESALVQAPRGHRFAMERDGQRPDLRRSHHRANTSNRAGYSADDLDSLPPSPPLAIHRCTRMVGMQPSALSPPRLREAWGGVGEGRRALTRGTSSTSTRLAGGSPPRSGHRDAGIWIAPSDAGARSARPGAGASDRVRPPPAGY